MKTGLHVGRPVETHRNFAFCYFFGYVSAGGAMGSAHVT